MTFRAEHHTPIGKVLQYEFVPGQNVWDIAEENKIPINTAPTVFVKNGEPVLRKDWDQSIEATDKICFITVPRGKSFSSILRIVASLALAILAPWAAGVIGSAFEITSEIGLALIQAGIYIAGSFLINALIPPDKPKDAESGSATYSMSPSGNQPRLLQPITKLYGNFCLTPDYAGQPYYEYINNQQILRQVFCLGLGEYEVDAVRVDDTEIWNSEDGYSDDFSGITLEIYNPGETVTLFHTQVVNSNEVSDQILSKWKIQDNFTFNAEGRIKVTADDKNFTLAVLGQKVKLTGTSEDGTYSIIDIDTNEKSVILNHSFTITSGSATIESDPDENWAGPFVVNPADTITNLIQVDWIFPQGLYEASDKDGSARNLSASVEVQARLINSAGLPEVGADWFVLGAHTYTRVSKTPQRISEKYPVSDGRYELRTRRTSYSTAFHARFFDQVTWAGLKAYIPDDNTYSDVTIMAMEIKVADQFSSQSSSKINTIQTAKIPVYNPGTETWTVLPTRSAAWAAYDIATNTTYGSKYPASSVDLDKLVALDTLWASRGDFFDGVFDTQVSGWDALATCTRVGRAHPIMIAGLLSFKRRGLEELPRCVFTPESIVRGSFQTEHIMFTDETTDDVIVEFIDRRTWKHNEVICSLPGSTHSKPERVQIVGITDRLQAWREGIFMAGYSERNRIAAEFAVELAGRLLTRGDYVIAAHDLWEWGHAGTVEFYVPADREVFLNREVTLDGSEYIMLRKRDGNGYGPIKCTQGEVDSVILDAADLAIVVAAQGPIANVWAYDNDQNKTSFVIQKLTTDYKRFTVVSGTPDNDVNVNLVVISDDPSVHTLEDELDPPSESYPFGYNDITGRVHITTFTAVKTVGSPGTAPVVDFAWSVGVPTPDSYILQISYDYTNWETIYEGTGLAHTEAVINGVLYARVAGILDGVLGAWRSFAGQIGDINVMPLPVASVTVDYANTSAGIVLDVSWSKGVRATSYELQIRTESVVDSGIFDTLLSLTVGGNPLGSSLSATRVIFSESDVLAADGPWKNIEVKVLSKNSSGTSAATTVYPPAFVLAAPNDVHLINPYASGKELYPEWDPVSAATRYQVRLYVSGVLKYAAYTTVPTLLISEGTINSLGGPWETVEIRVRAQKHTGSTVTLQGSETVLSTGIAPLMIGSKLLAWWDPTQGLGLASGVATWTDRKSGYILSQSTVGSRPAYSSTEFNGKHGLSFDGVDDFLTLESQPFPSGATPAESWVLVQQDDLVADTTTKPFFGYGSNAGATSRVVQRVVVSGVNRVRTVTGIGSAVNLTDTAVDFSGRHVIRAIFGAAQTSLRVDDAAIQSVAAVPTTGTTRTRLGTSQADSPVAYAKIKVRDVIVAEPLTADEAEELYAFLNSRK